MIEAMIAEPRCLQRSQAKRFLQVFLEEGSQSAVFAVGGLQGSR